MTRTKEENDEKIVTLARNPYKDAYKEKRHDDKFNKQPWSAYFYYVYRKQGENEYRVRQYYYASLHDEIERHELRMLITNLGTNARKPIDQQHPKPLRDDWKEMKWTRKSYLIFIIDVPGYQFVHDEAIVFDYDISGTRYDNHTFFDAKDFNDIRLPSGNGGTDEVAAAFCVNHMKRNEVGDDLVTGDIHPFHFEFNPQLRRRIVPDDGGLNLGPPVPPPA